MDKVYKLLGAFTWLIFLIILGGFILQTMWGWFLVPLGAQEVSLAGAIGVRLLISLGLVGVIFKDDTDVDRSQQSKQAQWAQLVASLFLFLAGWIVHLFM